MEIKTAALSASGSSVPAPPAWAAEQTVDEVIVTSIRESCPWVSDVRVEAASARISSRKPCDFSRGPWNEADDGEHPVLRVLIPGSTGAGIAHELRQAPHRHGLEFFNGINADS